MNNTIHKKLIVNLMIILSFLFISLLGTIILLHYHVIVNISDAQFHLKRIDEFINDIHHFNILPLYGFNQFNGSAVMTIYPYLNLLPMAILSFIFHSKLLIVLIYFIFQLFIGLIISFYSSLNFSKNTYTSYLFSVIYIISNVFLGYALNLVDFGSSSAYIFLPLVIFGFLDLLSCKNNYWKVSVGIILIIFSHVPDAIIFICLLIFLVLINIKKIHISTWLNLIKVVILTTLISSIFWLPFIILLINNKGLIHFTNPVIPPKIPVELFIKSALGSVDINGIGIFASIAIVLSCFYYKRFNVYIKQMFWISIIIIIFCSTLTKDIPIPNLILHILSNFQFMYRFLIIPVVFLSYIFSDIVTQFFVYKSRLIVFALVIFAIIAQIMGQVSFIHSYTNGSHQIIKSQDYLNYPIKNSGDMNFIINKRPNGANNKGIVTSESTGADYYPKASLSKLKYINSNKIFGNHHLRLNMKRRAYNTFEFNNKINNDSLKLPIVYYKNEQLHLYLNHKLVKYNVSKNDLIELNHIYRGHYMIKINVLPNKKLILIRNILFILGLLWILCLIISFIIIRRIKCNIIKIMERFL